MNKEQEQGFFNQIEKVLQTHEENYEFGAWEEFDAKRQKKKRRWPIYAWTAAAIVLLCLGIGVFDIAYQHDQYTDVIVMKNQEKMTEDTEIPAAQASPIPNHQQIQSMGNSVKISSSLKIKAENSFAKLVKTTVYPDVVKADQVISAARSSSSGSESIRSSSSVVEIDKPIAHKQDKFTPVVVGAYDSLINRHPTAISAKKHANKLTYSLVVSPSLSNQKINIGAGMELSYNLGNRLSVNSGLMYASLNAKSDGKSLATANTRSESANLAVSGIELPLGIQYQTNSGFYASAGVSALGLLNDKLEYNFVEDKTVSYSMVSAGGTNDVFKVVSERKTEKSIEPLNNYMGFFNFSAGKKQAFGSLNLNVGPFVKVPFSSVSSEKIKLLQGGIKISVDF